MCRAQVSNKIIIYFDNLIELINGAASSIVNYNETNFSDDPGRLILLFKRGTKYPE